ncbi:MAG: calcium-transporting P-type ATPase, PMR1-type [Clostridiales bacterium]|nr:calcium-transporting P-type ATPase, PMR1-type [Clostridiales bacterium]MCF8022729.1 calcium-transporting P-type ATPase, PMR1-type [Clostridiales bacterium]
MAGHWYQYDLNHLLKKLSTNLQKGLSDKDAEERKKSFGPNEIAHSPGVPLWQIFVNQFKDFMVIVLLAATLISVFLGEISDAVTIMIIVVINGILGMVQEYKAERSMEALKQLTAPEARVIRNGTERKVSAEKLVPGDIVFLGAGDKVPADVRLVESFNLQVEESALTGESNPVKKQEGNIESETSLGDIYNMCYMGTVITRGRGKGVVVSTGMATEMGQIAGLIQEAETVQTPLQRRLTQLGTWLVSFCLLICILVVLVGVFRGIPVYQMFLAGISLAVAAIPEGLPAIVTVSLALGVQRMIKRNAVVRKLPAVETLGCATAICSDKTGTLTQNEMTVRKALIAGKQVHVTGEGYEPHGEFNMHGEKDNDFKMFMSIASLCNNATLYRGNIAVGGFFRKLINKKESIWNISGDPTEGALMVMAAKAGYWKGHLEGEYTRVKEIPFESERKRMTAVYYHKSGKYYSYTKGAPDVILNLCTHYLKEGKIIPLTGDVKERILQSNNEMAGNALRVLGLAYREHSAQEDYLDENQVESSLVFVGLAGIMDPPRPAAVQAVSTCKKAGIKTIMITGDHRDTARAVSKEIGIMEKSSDQVFTGSELDNMDDKQLQKAVNSGAVYARVSPKHKLRIVRALKSNGHIVAMTGDGVNDAPAVKEADIGISMGTTGTDVTKESSAMILADDNFKTIVGAVEEGRGIYDNIRKFIRYLLSCNVGEVLVMFLAVLSGLPLPLLPLQILWMNLVTDGLPAMALGIEPIEKNVMSRQPREPDEGVFSHGLGWRIMGTGVVFAVGTLVIFFLTYLNSGLELDMARTVAFNTLVFFQLFFVFACRSEHQSLLEVGIFKNKYLLLAVAISVGLQLAVTYIPILQPIFHTVPLKSYHWLVILLFSTAPVVLGIAFRHLRLLIREKIAYLKI